MTTGNASYLLAIVTQARWQRPIRARGRNARALIQIVAKVSGKSWALQARLKGGEMPEKPGEMTALDESPGT
jgi:hypothetical protein